MSAWEYACLREAWAQLWPIKEKWRAGEIGDKEAMYEIETIMDETGE
tara:strand:- start:1503 stop:1643 length:141 start_codon:yes stop_codon:yes gene_type:complete